MRSRDVMVTWETRTGPKKVGNADKMGDKMRIAAIIFRDIEGEEVT
jgi:hypothetical protein